MSEDAFGQAINAFLGRQPFRAFVIEMMSGHQIVVRHPEAVAIGEQTILFRDTRGEFQVFDNQSVCRLFDSESARARPTT
jgi:hypothetical protein